MSQKNSQKNGLKADKITRKIERKIEYEIIFDFDEMKIHIEIDSDFDNLINDLIRSEIQIYNTDNDSHILEFNSWCTDTYHRLNRTFESFKISYIPEADIEELGEPED